MGGRLARNVAPYPRLRSRGYGATFLASLPPMPLLEDFADALAFAATLGFVAEPAAAMASP